MKTDPDSPATPDSSVPHMPSATPRPQRPHGKVFDVMRPGKAPASPTSRPVVIGHKHEAQASQAVVSGIGEANKDLLDGRKKINLSPVHDGQGASEGTVPAAPVTAQVPGKPEAPMPAETHEQPASAIAPEPASVEPQAASAPAPVAAHTEEDKEEDKFAEAAMEPEPPAPAAPEHHAAPLPQEESPKDDDPVHDIAPPSLEGQVVVSHHTTEPAGTGKLIALVILMLLFVLVVLDILLDVGIISSSAIPHTHLF